MQLLSDIKFNADPCVRAWLDDWDYGPIEALWGGHQAVVIYPRGNTNAIRHGLYSPRCNPAVYSQETERSHQNLEEEIALMRFFIRRLGERSENVENLYEAAGLLRVLSVASTSLTNMLKAHLLLFGSDHDAALSRAVKVVLADMRAEGAARHTPPAPLP